MINLPTGTRSDMIDAQTAQVALERTQLATLKAAGKGPGDHAYDVQQEVVSRVEDNQRRLQKQYDIMKAQVIGTP